MGICRRQHCEFPYKHIQKQSPAAALQNIVMKYFRKFTRKLIFWSIFSNKVDQQRLQHCSEIYEIIRTAMNDCSYIKQYFIPLNHRLSFYFFNKVKYFWILKVGLRYVCLNVLTLTQIFHKFLSDIADCLLRRFIAK